MPACARYWQGNGRKYMVKKVVEWYETTETITTPSQIRTYIDSCKDWLLTQSKEEHKDDEDVPTQSTPTPLVGQKIGNLGIVREHIYAQNVFDCFLCNASTEVRHGRVVNANPFTRSQSMLLCTDCASQVRSLAV